MSCSIHGTRDGSVVAVYRFESYNPISFEELQYAEKCIPDIADRVEYLDRSGKPAVFERQEPIGGASPAEKIGDKFLAQIKQSLSDEP